MFPLKQPEQSIIFKKRWDEPSTFSAKEKGYMDMYPNSFHCLANAFLLQKNYRFAPLEGVSTLFFLFFNQVLLGLNSYKNQLICECYSLLCPRVKTPTWDGGSRDACWQAQSDIYVHDILGCFSMLMKDPTNYAFLGFHAIKCHQRSVSMSRNLRILPRSESFFKGKS